MVMHCNVSIPVWGTGPGPPYRPRPSPPHGLIVAASGRGVRAQTASTVVHMVRAIPAHTTRLIAGYSRAWAERFPGYSAPIIGVASPSPTSH
jgi:hypothetical protein